MISFTNRLEKLCRSLLGTTDRVQWNDELVFKVGEKMFAVIALSEEQFGQLSVKCCEETFHELTQKEGIQGAPYLARAHWILIDFQVSGMRFSEAQELIHVSYGLVFDRIFLKQKLKIKQ